MAKKKTDLSKYRADIWESEEELDEFLEDVYQSRRRAPKRYRWMLHFQGSPKKRASHYVISAPLSLIDDFIETCLRLGKKPSKVLLRLVRDWMKEARKWSKTSTAD